MVAVTLIDVKSTRVGPGNGNLPRPAYEVFEFSLER